MDPHFEGVIFQTHASELAKRLGHEFPRHTVLDVRDAAAFASSHIPGAQRAPVGELASALPQGTDVSTEFFVLGADPEDTAVRAASQALRAHGARRVVEFSGGMSEWNAYGFGTEPGGAA